MWSQLFVWIVLAVTIVLLSLSPILIYVFYYLSKRKKELCTAKVTGCVEDYSFMSYNGLSLPVVGYWVRQSYYWAVGPHFQSCRYVTVSTPSSCLVTGQHYNLLDRKYLPDSLIIYRNKNSLFSLTSSSLLDLFPLVLASMFTTIHLSQSSPTSIDILRFCPKV